MRTAPLVLLLAGCLAISACVYFNTFYNAKKSFREAEKERRNPEETYADWAFDRAGPELQQRRSPQADQLYDKAVRKASKVLDEYKESDLVDDAMFLIGRAYYWRGEYLNAQESFRDLETFFPSSPYFDQARYWRARCLEEQRIDDQAQSLYRVLFDEAEEKIAVQAGLHLAEMAHDREDYVAAMREYRATLEAFPKSAVRAQLWLRLGEALMALEDPARLDEALAVFDEVLKADPSEDQKYRARLNSGRTLYAMGAEDEALATYVSLLDEGGFRRFEGRTRLLIGEWYQGRRLLDEALVEYERVRNDFPQTPSAAMALYRIGLLRLQEYGDTELGREYLEESSRESPGAQGVLLAQEMLGHMRRLEQIQRQIHRADSLYADSLGAVQGPLLWQVAEAPADTVVVARSLDVLDDLFSACELYRDDIGQADSARAYYEEVIRRFPDSDQLPRAVYSLAWIELQMRDDEEIARPHLLRLIEEFPTSAHANEARRLLGQKLEATAEELAARAFARIETLRLAQPEATEAYLPLLDSLSHAFACTPSGGQAAFLAANTYENVVGDTVAAEQRYQLLREEFAETRFGKLAQQRREAREEKLIDKLERSLKAIGGQLGPGERIELLALEPDTLDTVALARKYVGFAERAQRRGDVALARDFYERSIDQQVANPRALYQLGNINWEEGYFNDAIEFYRQALSFDKRNLNLYYRLWRAFTEQGVEDSANYYLREVARRDRNSAQIRFLVEKYPDFQGGQDREDLDVEAMIELDLSIPPDELGWKEGDLALSDWPLVRQVVRPVYPAAAEDSVEVLLDVLIDREGRPEQVEVFRGEPPFVESAVDAAYSYSFYPAVRRNGEEIKSWVELTVPFGSPQEEGLRPELSRREEP
ncbi:MAG: tetratricopeptide repeat protein [Gemmatimonadetes bacterium]|nr:tetratricopeptide repeat protein [Gemmatimonadota bacterium]